MSEAVLRVRGASDYRVLLNDVEVARGGLAGDDAPASFSVPATLLRAGRNALALEGFVRGETAKPSLELVLVEAAPR